MDSTLGTIREEIRKNREGNIPTLILVIDTNILADHAWARDNSGACLKRIKDILK